MNEELTHRIRTAAIAAWWTILIGAIVVTLQWLAYMFVMSHRPNWVLCAWGPDMSWHHMQRVWLMGIFVFKVILWIGIFIAIWLSLWARRLRRSTPAGR